MYVTVDEVLAAYSWPDTPEMRTMVEGYILSAQDLINQELGYTFDVIDENNPDSEHALVFNHDFGPTIRLTRPARSISKVEVLNEDGVVTHEIRPFYVYPTAAHTSRLDGEKRPLIFRVTEDIVGDEDYSKSYLSRRGSSSIRITGVWGTDSVPSIVRYVALLMIKRLDKATQYDPTVKMEQGVGRTVEFHDPSQATDILLDRSMVNMLAPWKMSILSES